MLNAMVKTNKPWDRPLPRRHGSKTVTQASAAWPGQPFGQRRDDAVPESALGRGPPIGRLITGGGVRAAGQQSSSRAA